MWFAQLSRQPGDIIDKINKNVAIKVQWLSPAAGGEKKQKKFSFAFLFFSEKNFYGRGGKREKSCRFCEGKGKNQNKKLSAAQRKTWKCENPIFEMWLRNGQKFDEENLHVSSWMLPLHLVYGENLSNPPTP